MISASNDFMAKVNNGDAPSFRMKLLTASGTEYWIEDNQFWSSGISFTDGTSANGSFDVGSAIIGSFDFVLNNFDGYFDDIELRGAIVFPYAYYTINGERDEIPKGTFYVATHTTSGHIIRCKALDGLKLFDQSDTPVVYPVTFESLVRMLAAANNINVADNLIPNGSYVIDTEPKDSLTDRQKLSYACQITGNFAVMNSEGELHIGWYDYENPVRITTTFDGKNLWTKPIELTGLSVTIPKSTESEAILRMDILSDGHLYFTNNTDVEVEFSINAQGELLATTPDGVSDQWTIIDGVLYRTGGEYKTRDGDITFLYGTDENVIYIKDNPYITQDNLLEVAEMVGQRVLGQTIRPGTLPVLANPCLEAGDVLQITDRVTGLVYLFPITNFTYNRSVTESVTCDFQAKEYDDLRPTAEYNIREIIRKTVTDYYTWVAYADDASGTNISLSNVGKNYIGIATNQTTETPDISDPTVYTWKKYVGTGISTITYYYKKQASTDPVPSTPTTDPPSGWDATEPTYNPSTDANSVVYTCSKITYSDGTYGYTTPQLSSSYTASKAAYIEANNALTTANGKNKVFYQGTAPTGGTYTAGDTWFDTAHGNLIYEYDGTNWATSHTFGTQAIADLAITNAKIAALDAGKIQTGELSTILIRSNNNDYWNLSGNDIVKTEGGVTYTFKANTLQTNHLIAEDDVYVDGGPGSYLKIPTDNNGLSYMELDNGGMTVKSSDIETLYPSDMTAVVDVLDSTNWAWSTESVDNAVYVSTIDSESTYSPGYEELLCDVYDPNGVFVEQSNQYAEFTHRSSYVNSAVQSLTSLKQYGNSIGTIDDYIVPSGPYAGYKYVPVRDPEHLKSKASYGTSSISLAHMEDNLVRNFEIDLNDGLMNVAGNAWQISLGSALYPSSVRFNGGEVSPIGKAYPTDAQCYGACAVWHDTGFKTYMSLAYNPTNGRLYVFASDDPTNVGYVGSVALQ